MYSQSQLKLTEEAHFADTMNLMEDDVDDFYLSANKRQICSHSNLQSTYINIIRRKAYLHERVRFN